jgi:DNA-binding MarR family transcriptional regulator
MALRKRPPNSRNPERSTFLLFHQTQQKIDLEQNKLLRKYKLTPRQFIILQTIDYHPLISQNQIQKYTKIDRTTISEIIKKLEIKNLVDCQLNADDRRHKEIRISNKGRNILRRLQANIEKKESDFLKELIFKTQKKFLDSLKKYVKD